MVGFCYKIQGKSRETLINIYCNVNNGYTTYGCDDHREVCKFIALLLLSALMLLLDPCFIDMDQQRPSQEMLCHT